MEKGTIKGIWGCGRREQSDPSRGDATSCLNGTVASHTIHLHYTHILEELDSVWSDMKIGVIQCENNPKYNIVENIV